MPYADPEKQREYQRAYSKKWFKGLSTEQVKERNARSYRSSGRNSALKRNYGLTEQEVNWMLVEQGGECPLCQRDISKKHCVDHNHTTGKVRRLLCYRCNVALSAIEIPGWKEIAEKYVTDHA